MIRGEYLRARWPDLIYSVHDTEAEGIAGPSDLLAKEDIDKLDEAISQIEHGEMESTSASADELRVIDEADHRCNHKQ
jgi:hypothetical protein